MDLRTRSIRGVGAGLNPALGAAIAQAIGCPAAFLILGSFALGSRVLWVAFSPPLKPACARPSQAEDRDILAAAA